MEFITTLKEIDSSKQIELHNVPIVDDIGYHVDDLNIRWQFETEVRNYGIKDLSVTVQEVKGYLLVDDDDETKIMFDDFEISVNPPTTFDTVYIDFVEIDIEGKYIEIHFE